MTENTDDWLNRLADPAACETEKERAVMEAVRSGLRAADSPSQTDQLTLERLHKRIASQGLYDPPLVRSRRTQLLGYAAVLLMGVGLVMTYTFSNKPLHEAALQVAVVSPSASESYAKQYMARSEADDKESERRPAAGATVEAEAYASPQPMAAATAKPSAPKDQPQYEYRSNNFAADVAESEQPISQQLASKQAAAKKQTQVIRLSLSVDQWRGLYALNQDGLSLKKGDEAGLWVLLISSELAKLQWLDRLPESYRDERWSINTEIDMQVDIRDD
jgi:hypothetical protein